jgi:hypothetical protein
MMEGTQKQRKRGVRERKGSGESGRYKKIREMIEQIRGQ